jgi:hypothetical protein
MSRRKNISKPAHAVRDGIGLYLARSFGCGDVVVGVGRGRLRPNTMPNKALSPKRRL